MQIRLLAEILSRRAYKRREPVQGGWSSLGGRSAQVDPRGGGRIWNRDGGALLGHHVAPDAPELIELRLHQDLSRRHKEEKNNL